MLFGFGPNLAIEVGASKGRRHKVGNQFIQIQIEDKRRPSSQQHLESAVFVVEKASFLTCFGHLKGGVRETIFLEPIY